MLNRNDIHTELTEASADGNGSVATYFVIDSSNGLVLGEMHHVYDPDHENPHVCFLEVDPDYNGCGEAELIGDFEAGLTGFLQIINGEADEC